MNDMRYMRRKVAQKQCPQTSLTGDLQLLQLLHLVQVQFELSLKEVTWLSNVWWLLCF